jgi:hypothetical protein
MTINVVLVTPDAVILGCDSTATRSQYYIDPFAIGINAPDPDGKVSLEFHLSDMEHIVTDAWGGVTKMFALADAGGCHVAAVTAGLASLNQRSMASLATEFFTNNRPKKKIQKSGKSVEDVAKDFLQFMRQQYDQHFATSQLPEDFRDGPEFLVGGVSPKDTFPACYRVLVKENTATKSFASGDCGLSWNGQSDAVERVIRGYDGKLRWRIEQFFLGAIKTYQDDMNKAVLRIIDDILTKLNAQMPAGVDTTLPNQISGSPDWNVLRAAIPYGALPLQEAVNFVGYLITMQAGKSRFASGIATVGGRVHVGVITREDGFKKLNEPQLSHKHTGFADD